MSKTTAPSLAPSPKLANESKVVKTDRSPSQQFIVLALDMSWRLAIVVLVPIIGGYYLGRHFKATALLTILGFILALLLAALVVARTAREAGRQTGGKDV